MNFLRLLSANQSEVKLPSIVVLQEIINYTSFTYSLGFSLVNPETGEVRLQKDGIFIRTTESSSTNYQLHFAKDYKAEKGFIVYKDFVN